MMIFSNLTAAVGLMKLVRRAAGALAGVYRLRISVRVRVVLCVRRAPLAALLIATGLMAGGLTSTTAAGPPAIRGGPPNSGGGIQSLSGGRIQSLTVFDRGIRPECYSYAVKALPPLFGRNEGDPTILAIADELRQLAYSNVSYIKGDPDVMVRDAVAALALKKGRGVIKARQAFDDLPESAPAEAKAQVAKSLARAAYNRAIYEHRRALSQEPQMKRFLGGLDEIIKSPPVAAKPSVVPTRAQMLAGLAELNRSSPTKFVDLLIMAQQKVDGESDPDHLARALTHLGFGQEAVKLAKKRAAELQQEKSHPRSGSGVLEKIQRNAQRALKALEKALNVASGSIPLGMVGQLAFGG